MLARYELDGAVATITMDDGKANALSPAMLGEIGEGLDRAEGDGAAAVVLSGRPGMFSGGFDLKIIQRFDDQTVAMVRGGFELAERILGFPRPVVIACTGHAVAMGTFLLLSGDYRIGAAGDFRYVANEVAIGLTMPQPAIDITRWRLAPAHADRALLLAEVYSPGGEAVAAGFVDRVVEPGQVAAVALEQAEQLAKLDAKAHAESKRRVRAPLLAALRASIETDAAAAIG